MSLRLSLVLALVAALGAWDYRGRIAEAEYLELTKSLSDARLEAADAAAIRNAAIKQAIIATDKARIEAEKAKKAAAKTITKEVIRYVENPDIQRCHLDSEWVQHHDSAATGRVLYDTDTTGSHDAAASEITDADALEVVVDNYLTCQEISDRLTALQRWLIVTGIAESNN